MDTDHRQDWDAYWSSAGGVGVFSQFTGAAEALRTFWSDFFKDVCGGEHSRRVLDLACGSGAVTTVARETAKAQGREDIFPICLDYSVSALMDLIRREDDVLGVVSNARATPFADNSFDIVVSQFGLEYAGPEAFGEAARLLARGGMFTAICHLEGGTIHAECVDNLDAIQKVIDSRFLPLAKSAFSCAFALDRGLGTPRAADDSAKALFVASETVKALLQSKGTDVASRLPARLYQDLGRITKRLRNYAPEEIFNWIDAMIGELDAYAGRMASMTGAAINDDEMGNIRQAMSAAGLEVSEPEKLELKAGGGPAAWAVRARL